MYERRTGNGNGDRRATPATQPINRPQTQAPQRFDQASTSKYESFFLATKGIQDTIARNVWNIDGSVAR